MSNTKVPSKGNAKHAVVAASILALVLSCALAGCAQQGAPSQGSSKSTNTSFSSVEDRSASSSDMASSTSASSASSKSSASSASSSSSSASASVSSASAKPAQAQQAELDRIEDYRASFEHGYKGPEYQKYIVMHDTEGEGDPGSVIDYWDGNGNLVAAHFIVGKDGTIYQCVPMDSIAHHAGFGDAGHNELYGVEDESRDDKLGTVPIGDWAPDYGMNSYSIGIEMVHVGGNGDYPIEQLEAVDRLIAYIDAYYGGNAGEIIDHKAWRTGNSDTSLEFAEYLANLQDHRSCF